MFMLKNAKSNVKTLDELILWHIEKCIGLKFQELAFKTTFSYIIMNKFIYNFLIAINCFV